VDFAFGLRWFKPPKFWGTRGRQEKGARKKQMTLFFSKTLTVWVAQNYSRQLMNQIKKYSESVFPRPTPTK
jgi:hypothetical protein